MSSKMLIIGIGFFSLLLVFGSYFLFFNEKQSVTVISYSKDNKSRPVAKIDKTFFDMGKIKVSETRTAEFTIKNTGQKPLALFDISSSCNCTTAQIVYQGKTSKEYGMHAKSDTTIEILPQTEAKIKVIYRPFVMPVYGLVEREAYIATNDPVNQKLAFKVKAIVQ